MPKGLPPDLTSLLLNQLHRARTYFEIPTHEEYSISFRSALIDSYAALRSTFHLIFLTFRPITILLLLIFQHLYSLGKIIAKHTFIHAWIVTKEFSFQVSVLCRAAAKYQKGLSNFALLMELCGVCAIILAVLLRRFIKKRRYVERVKGWYRTKRNGVLKAYERIIRRISETSITLALLFPHFLYMILSIGLRYFLPDVIPYLANKTYAIDLISLVIPLVRTVLIVSNGRTGGITGSNNETTEKSEDGKEEKEEKKTTERKKGKLSMRYLEAAQRSSSKSNEPEKTLKIKPVKASNSLQLKNDPVQSASKMVRYWVVYTLLQAAIHIICLMPFSRTIAKLRYFPSQSFFNQTFLFFYIWLHYLPTAKTQPSTKNRLLGTTPTNILFHYLYPTALQICNSFSFFLSSSNKKTNAITSKLTSLLDLCVLVRLLSQNSKEKIISTALHTQALLPAIFTLCMPSTFTNFGCIYANSILPAANATHCEVPSKHPRGGASDSQLQIERVQCLKFYVLSTLFHLLLRKISHILAWVPFSTHGTLVVWLWLNLPEATKLGGAGVLYRFLEYELIGFGILDARSTKKEEKELVVNVEDTMTVRMLRRLGSSLPSAHSSEKEGEEAVVKKDENGIEEKNEGKEANTVGEDKEGETVDSTPTEVDNSESQNPAEIEEEVVDTAGIPNDANLVEEIPETKLEENSQQKEESVEINKPPE